MGALVVIIVVNIELISSTNYSRHQVNQGFNIFLNWITIITFHGFIYYCHDFVTDYELGMKDPEYM